MNKITLVFVILNVFSFCKIQDNNTLVSRIEKHCNQNYPCQFDMAELINIEWDRVYLFKEEASLEFINGKIGFSYPYFIDVARRIIFVKNNTVVYHEDIDIFASVEGPRNRDLYFELPDSIRYIEIKRGSAMFTVERVGIRDIFIYKIAPRGN